MEEEEEEEEEEETNINFRRRRRRILIRLEHRRLGTARGSETVLPSVRDVRDRRESTTGRERWIKNQSIDAFVRHARVEFRSQQTV